MQVSMEREISELLLLLLEILKMLFKLLMKMKRKMISIEV